MKDQCNLRKQRARKVKALWKKKEQRDATKRHKDFPIGRVCVICGRGQTPKLGGCFGAAPALLALGYTWDTNESLGHAHLACLNRIRKENGNE